MKIQSKYEEYVRSKSILRFLMGIIVRWFYWQYYRLARYIAQKRGAQVGDNVAMSIKLARRLNSNVRIGNNVSIQTNFIDVRSPLVIGNNVIIGSGTQIITTSHNIDSEEWEHKYYGLTINDYVWIPTKCLILPSCRVIGYGAVISSGSVVENPLENDPLVTQLFDPLPFSFSSKKKMQADEMKNRSSLHSI